MKKDYMSPSVEVVKFQYRDQVVAASGQACTNKWANVGEKGCESGVPEWIETFSD